MIKVSNCKKIRSRKMLCVGWGGWDFGRIWRGRAQAHRIICWGTDEKSFTVVVLGVKDPKETVPPFIIEPIGHPFISYVGRWLYPLRQQWLRPFVVRPSLVDDVCAAAGFHAIIQKNEEFLYNGRYVIQIGFTCVSKLDIYISLIISCLFVFLQPAKLK